MSAFLNQERPEARNNFWTQPEVELDIAASAGVQVRCRAARAYAAATHARCRHAPAGGPSGGRSRRWRHACAEPSRRCSLAQLFRLGVDWGRVIPAAPTREGGSVPDAAALARYREIIQARATRRMRVAVAPR